MAHKDDALNAMSRRSFLKTSTLAGVGLGRVHQCLLKFGRGGRRGVFFGVSVIGAFFGIHHGLSILPKELPFQSAYGK